MNRKTFPFAIAALVFTVLACNSILPQAEPTPTLLPTQPQSNSVLQSEDQVPRIGVKEAKAAYDSGAAIFVDTRNAEFYAKGHIPSARSIPLDRFEYDFASISLQRQQWIVTYCT